MIAGNTVDFVNKQIVHSGKIYWMTEFYEKKFSNTILCVIRVDDKKVSEIQIDRNLNKIVYLMRDGTSAVYSGISQEMGYHLVI